MLGLRSLGVVVLLPPLFLLAGALPAAQEPKLGSTWYEDKVDLGFKVKAPKDWAFVPGSPLERNLIGKYAAEKGQDLHLGHDALLEVAVYLVKFDRRKAGKTETRQIGDQTVEISTEGAKDVDAWMTGGIDEGMQWHKGEVQKPLKGALEAQVVFYEGMSSTYIGTAHESQPVRAYVATFTLSPEVDLAVVGLGPGDDKKWRTFESAYAAIAKSLQPLKLTEPSASAPPVGKDPRSQKRAKLQTDVAKSPGWTLSETPNYFIVSASDDKAFVEELKVRLEAIRTVYEKDYPPETARKIIKKPKATASGEPGKAPETDQEPDPHRTESGVSALELGKCSVVRLCKSQDQYMQYGAPPQTSGYFSPIEEELLVYDDKADEGRDATWATLNHEGFHQYIYAFFGNLAPHSWYNEGTGDYYAGFDFNLKTKKFTAKIDKGRQDNLLLIRDKYAPLKDFVHWTKAQYYGDNKGNGNAGGRLDGWACYAEGWSLIWFLRTGAGQAKGWQKEWASILDKYLWKLLETSDTDAALDAAFEGVDWDAFEACWKDYMM